MLSKSLPESKVHAYYNHEVDRVAKRASESVLAFTKYMNPDFKINWHHRVMCRHLDRFVRGELIRLMIFVQPQTGKSELVSRHLPAFIFGHDPDHRLISATYGDSFASLFNIDVQRIIESERYRRIFPNVHLAGPGHPGNWVRNTSVFDIVEHKGRYHSVGVGGSLTGRTGNTLLIDDPVKNDEDARSAGNREKQFNWYTSVARTRLKKSRKGIRPKVLLTCTRWHEDGLEARLLKVAKANPNLPQWTVLKFPALREDMNDPLDPRGLDEPLWPDHMTREDCEEIKQTNPRTWAALYQQRPSPAGGNIVQRSWWKFYKELPADMEQQIQSWDLTFKKGKKTDFVVGQVWAKKGANKYLLDQVRARMGFNDQLSAIATLSAKWPEAMAKYIEQAANAEALLDTLKDKIPGLILVPAKSSKLARAEAVAPQIAAGNIWLPDPSIAPWVHDFIEEWADFTGDDDLHDDQVDAGSQGIKKITDAPSDDWAPISITKVSTWTK